MIPIRSRNPIAKKRVSATPKTLPIKLAEVPTIPGHIQETNVEKINQIGNALKLLASPTKILSPLTKVYLSISIFMKNWKVRPRIAPQMIPRPKLLARYGQSISSPLPSPKPRRIKEGPKSFLKEGAGGISSISCSLSIK